MFRQKGKNKWSDGSSIGFMQRNERYVSGLGLKSIKRVEQNKTLEYIPQNTQNLQPPHTDNSICTILMGFPGASNMEYLTQSCNKSTEVSGLLCSIKNFKPSPSKLVYRVTHLKLQQWNSSQVTNKMSSFNFETWKAWFAPQKNGTENDNVIASEHIKSSSNSANHLRWLWTESTRDCTTSRIDQLTCSLLVNGDINTSVKIHKISQDVAFSYNDSSSMLDNSVYQLGQHLIASTYCEEGTFQVNAHCIKVVSIRSLPSDFEMNVLLTSNGINKACNFSGGNKAFSLTSTSNESQTIVTILQKQNFDEDDVALLDQFASVIQVDRNGTIFSASRDQIPELFICSTNPVQTTCPTGYTHCTSQCISELFLCDGVVNCPDEADESDCAHVCHASYPTTLLFCLRECHPHNCTCHSLYFQCPSGGCLHNTNLCDRNQDCFDGEDEEMCPGSHVKGHELTAVAGNFLSDTVDAIDKYANMQQIISNTDHLQAVCNSNTHTRCLEGDHSSYPIEKTCVYDLAEHGRLRYCKNGLHLINCQEVTCSGTFKCRHSYCVPAHRVCNGALDCPYGDDENMCPIISCTNMLHCGNICVHPNEICDGITHCDDGEDELLCGVPQCPESCECNGFAVKCTSLLFNQSDIYSKSQVNQLVHINRGVFQSPRIVFLLDLSWSNISNFQSLSVFQSLVALLRLDASHNAIVVLTAGSLDGLDSLYELDISWNPLRQVGDRVFHGLQNLRIVNLRRCRKLIFGRSSMNQVHLIRLDISQCVSLQLVPLCCINSSVQLLNLTGTLLHDIREDLASFPVDVSSVLSDQRGLHCSNLFEGLESEGKGCKGTFTSAFLLYYTVFLIVVISLSNVLVILSKSQTCDFDAFVICNLSLSNILTIVPLIVFISWHFRYGNTFTFYESFVSKDVWCGIAGGITISAAQLSAITLFFLSLLRYFGIVKTEFVVVLKNHIYQTIIACWCATYGLCFAIRTYYIESSLQEISECLFSQRNPGYRSLLLFFGIISIVCTIGNLLLHAMIVKHILRSRSIQVGRRHGKTVYGSSLASLTGAIIWAAFCILPTGVLMLWMFADGGLTPSVHTTVILVICVFSSHSVTSPFMFTLLTRKVLSYVKKRFIHTPSQTKKI